MAAKNYPFGQIYIVLKLWLDIEEQSSHLVKLSMAPVLILGFLFSSIVIKTLDIEIKNFTELTPFFIDSMWIEPSGIPNENGVG